MGVGGALKTSGDTLHFIIAYLNLDVPVCQPAVPAAEQINYCREQKIMGAALARKSVGSPHEVALTSALHPSPLLGLWQSGRVADLQQSQE